MFFAWHEHFAGVLFLRMETIRAMQGKNHLSPYMTDSLVSLRKDIQLKGQKGRKEGNR